MSGLVSLFIVWGNSFVNWPYLFHYLFVLLLLNSLASGVTLRYFHPPHAFSGGLFSDILDI